MYTSDFFFLAIGPLDIAWWLLVLLNLIQKNGDLLSELSLRSLDPADVKPVNINDELITLFKLTERLFKIL